MTLFDCKPNTVGKIGAIGGDADTHRRLVDMGLMDMGCFVRVKSRRAVLADFDCGFTAVVQSDLATEIEVAVRK